MRVLMISKALVVGAYQKKCEELARLPGMDLHVVVPPAWQEPGGRRLVVERAFTHGYELAVEKETVDSDFHRRCGRYYSTPAAETPSSSNPIFPSLSFVPLCHRGQRDART